MIIHWLSNAPWAPTGYGNQTRLFTPRIRDLGHEINLTAFYGLEGNKLHFDGMDIYPKGRDVWGNDIAAANTRQAGGKVLLTLMDTWVLNPDMLQLHGVRWIPWFPVDMEPVPPPIARNVKKAYRRIVFSKRAEALMHDADMDCYYVPHGIDTDVFKPMPDRDEARERFGWGDKYVIGTVAANKGNPSRKSLPEMLQAFARFHAVHPDSLFYLHTMTGENGEAQGINLPELCGQLGLTIGESVLFPDQYRLHLGAYGDEYMQAIYNAFDVFLLPSMGEGFGIPVVEAQACGCPVIVGDWTATAELCFAGWKLDRADATPWYTPLASYQFLPRVDAIVDALECAYRQSGSRELRERAIKGARRYDADRVTRKYWKPVLADIEKAVGAWQE